MEIPVEPSIAPHCSKTHTSTATGEDFCQIIVQMNINLALLVDDAPPSKSGEESAADVLHRPEVCGEEEGDQDEGGDEGVEGEHVEQQGGELEHHVEEDHAAVGRSSLPLSYHPGNHQESSEKGKAKQAGDQGEPTYQEARWTQAAPLGHGLPTECIRCSTSF